MESYAGSHTGKRGGSNEAVSRLAHKREMYIKPAPKVDEQIPLGDGLDTFGVARIDGPQRPTQHAEQGYCSESLRDRAYVSTGLTFAIQISFLTRE
jgi:hypothetical protein